MKEEGHSAWLLVDLFGIACGVGCVVVYIVAVAMKESGYYQSMLLLLEDDRLPRPSCDSSIVPRTPTKYILALVSALLLLLVDSIIIVRWITS